MELTKTKYKQTAVGLIPSDWNELAIGKIVKNIIDYRGVTPKKLGMDWGGGEIVALSAGNVKKGYIDFNSECYYGSDILYKRWMRNGSVAKNDIVFTLEAPLGNVALIPDNKKYILSQRTILLQLNEEYWSPYIYQLLLSSLFQNYITASATGSTAQGIKRTTFEKLKTVIPPTISEQKAIATVLSDIDDLIANLDKLISKKKAIKQGAMQQLLTPPHKGGKRLSGYTGEWEFLTIESVADCLDNLRVPLNGEQRGKMNGDIPYCGANGVVDYVNDFVIDDDIILMAEDGGYFDEYKTRPIAYRMKGKCWVNNHAHILKAKNNTDQGFLYFSLVHKNILDYINGGTRAKLNKGEMNKIECWFPKSKNEQEAISGILSDMDMEIEQLETKKAKYQAIKQGMTQELLTGKTRLI